jgi:hypothetical protein
MSRRNNRKNPHKAPPSQRKRNGNGPERVYQFTEPPQPVQLTDVSRIQIAGGHDEPPAQAAAGFGSRGNRLRAGLRSRLLFPDAMKQAIDERTRDFTAELNPVGSLQQWLVGQLAMGSVQSEFAGDQLLVNLALAAERVDTRWEEDRREEADKLGARLAKSPCRVARALGRTKYGAVYLIDKLTSLGESIATQGGLDEEQRAYLFDVLAIDPVLRKGSLRVPAGSNGPALAEAVAKEKKRLSNKLEQSLNGQDLAEQSAARLGIVRSHDQETLNLRSDQRRADRRYKWAWDVLGQLRRGVDPATIIDPETRRPIQAGAQPSPAQEAPPQAPPPPPPPPPPQESTPTEPAPPTPISMPAIPDGCPDEVKQMFLLLGEAYLRRTRSSGEAPEEPGPTSA